MTLADPVAARSEARALIARTLDRELESSLRYGCLSSSFCVLLSCVGRGLATHSSKESYRLSMIHNFRINSELEQDTRPNP
jgi:hypothetical protein